MKYQLVLQWSTDVLDYDSMVSLEEEIEAALDDASEVDGHDAGSGEANIFIVTDTPHEAFVALKDVLQSTGHLADVSAAYRELSGSKYVPLWPSALRSFTVK